MAPPAAQANGTSWVRRLRSAGAVAGAAGDAASRVRLVCFPHAGGAATAFAPLAQALPPAIETLALQYPGRQDRLAEPCLESVDDLVAALLPELRPCLDVPFALFGHSTGAVVAYEVARVLEREDGVVPVGLVASGRRGPSTHRDEHVHRGGDRSLLREVARLGGTPPELLADEEVQQMMLPALRGDYKAIETYTWRPGPPLRCPIRAIHGDADPLTTRAEAAAWSSHTTGPFTLKSFSGRHFYFTPDLSALTAFLAAELATET